MPGVTNLLNILYIRATSRILSRLMDNLLLFFFYRPTVYNSMQLVMMLTYGRTLIN